jgi:hypothetical protein
LSLNALSLEQTSPKEICYSLPVSPSVLNHQVPEDILSATSAQIAG